MVINIMDGGPTPATASSSASIQMAPRGEARQLLAQAAALQMPAALQNASPVSEDSTSESEPGVTESPFVAANVALGGEFGSALLGGWAGSDDEEN